MKQAAGDPRRSTGKTQGLRRKTGLLAEPWGLWQERHFFLEREWTVEVPAP